MDRWVMDRILRLVDFVVVLHDNGRTRQWIDLTMVLLASRLN